MSKTVQWKRGNTTVNSTYVGAEGEITVNVDNWNLHVHDGITPGGYVIDSSNGGGSYSNLTVTGNISTGNLNVAYILNANTLVTTGNITAPYFIGNGSLLTGIASYSNANVVAYGQAGWNGNIIPAANAVYTLGNITNQWANLWVADNTIYIGNIALGINNSNILTINSEPILSNNSNTTIGTTGNITAGNLSTYRITGSFGNITNLLGIESLEFSNSTEIDGTTGNASLGNILLTGNITSDYFIGNGSLLTGVTSYSNAEVVSYGETGWSGNIIPSTNNTFTLGNITNQWANLWVANNTIYLGNIAIGINDANVLTVNGQPTLSNDSNTTINTDGNLTAGNLIGYRTTSTFGNITNLLGVESLEFTDGSEIDGTTGNASLGNLILSGNITGSNTLTIQVPAGGSSKLTNRIDETINSSYSGSWDTAEWINSGGTGIISILNASGSMRRYLELRMAVANPNTATFTINGEPTVYTFNGWNYNQSTGITEIYLAEVPASSPTVVTSLNFLAQVRNIIELNDYDNQLNLQSYSGWPINIRSGYEGDVNINAGDDITIEAGDKTRSDSSGGFIGIYSGKGGDADNVDAGGSGGFLNLYAGYGGDASNDYSAGSGGGVELRAGNGGSARASAGQQAGTGGMLTIAAGQGGNNDGDTSLGAIGGDLYLYSGDSTSNGTQGGSILIYAGSGGTNAGSGNVTIRTSNNAGMAVTSWTFDYTGNLTLPSNIASINYSNGFPYVGSSYSNANVVAYSEAGFEGNIIPAVNATYTLGNITNQWANLWVANNTIYLGNIAIGVNDSNVLTVNGQPTLSNNSNTTINTDGNITAGNLYAYRITGSFGNIANVVGVESLEFTNGSEINGTTGNASLGNITASGNISANYFVGNGSLLTGITAGSNYTNSNVVNLLSNFGSNTIVTTGNITGGNIIGNITITGNVTGTSSNVELVAGIYTWTFNNAGNLVLPANTFAINYANGAAVSLGSGGAGNYGDSNVVTLLSSFGSNSIVTTGNANIGNIVIKGNVTTGVNAAIIGVTNTLLTNTIASFSSNVNGYSQVTLQNKNNGLDATADYIITADNGSDTVNYADFGIINSGYDNATPTNSLGNIVYAADTYLYAQGNASATSQSGGNLVIGTTTSSKTVKIFAGGANVNSLIANISSTGVTVTGNVSVSGNITGTTPNVNLVAGSYTYTFDNTGNVTINGTGIKMPSRPASRVYGSSSTNIVSGTTLTNTNFTVDYNQGNHLNATTGVFTAPVAGLYQTTLVARVGNNNGLNQAAVIKNNGALTGANVICFWETDTNTGTASHFGTSGVANLVAGDTLRVNVVAGNIQFDSNDSWTVTYIG